MAPKSMHSIMVHINRNSEEFQLPWYIIFWYEKKCGKTNKMFLQSKKRKRNRAQTCLCYPKAKKFSSTFKINTIYFTKQCFSLYLATIILLLARFGQDVLGTGDDDDTPTGQFCHPPRSVNRTADKPLTRETFQFGRLCDKYISIL